MKKLLSVLVALMMLCAVPAMAEKLTMATNATFPPYEYVDEGSAFGGFAGIDVEVADAIAKKLGYEGEHLLLLPLCHRHPGRHRQGRLPHHQRGRSAGRGRCL